jgi:hypothetical protein
VLILETDHVIMKPIPNLATPETPAAFVFGYMYPQQNQLWVIKKYWPEGTLDKVPLIVGPSPISLHLECSARRPPPHSPQVQPVGPSPVIIHLDQLQKVYQKWLDFSMELRSNADAEKDIQGWVQEMWGYSIAAASLGIRHKLVENFQV